MSTQQQYVEEVQKGGLKEALVHRRCTCTTVVWRGLHLQLESHSSLPGARDGTGSNPTQPGMRACTGRMLYNTFITAHADLANGD